MHTSTTVATRRPLALLLTLVAAAWALSGCGPAIDPAMPPFRAIGFDEALAEASREGKVVFIDFYASWCPPCRRLAAVTWSDPAVQEWLTTNTVPLKIDAERSASLAERFSVEAYPTLVFVDASGREIGRFLGFRDPEAFIAGGAQVLAAARP